MIRTIILGMALLYFCRPLLSDSLSVLLITGRNNHDWQSTTPVLEKLYNDHPRFTIDKTLRSDDLNHRQLSQYHVVLSTWSAWPDVNGRQWGREAEQALLDFVRRGNGFVLFHSAGATFHDWPEYQQLIGAIWDKGKTGHGKRHCFKVCINRSGHPVTAGMSGFWIYDAN
ncbi:MAG: ThuA domain-containing protein [candidate division KSB1 bacterium]|nr:ThuA domain-containing protein [candidate division KSB1 bacterium]